MHEPMALPVQIHFADDEQDAYRIANNLVNLYKDYGWVIIETNAQVWLNSIYIAAEKHNGDLKRDEVRW